MPVTGFDHVSYPTDDSERFLEFYKRLGFTVLGEERWRSGKSPIFSIQIGDASMINVHPGGFRPPPHLRGRGARPGCADFCFVWDGAVEDVLAMLDRAGVQPVEGPVPRRGGRGAGAVPSQSVYIQDPDGNLLEFMVYDSQ